MRSYLLLPLNFISSMLSCKSLVHMQGCLFLQNTIFVAFENDARDVTIVWVRDVYVFEVPDQVMTSW
jgi:hypothetical protein